MVPPTDSDSILSIVTNQRNRLRQRWLSLHSLAARCLDTVCARPVQRSYRLLLPSVTVLVVTAICQGLQTHPGASQ